MITDAVAGAISSIFESTFAGLDKLFTSEDERNKAKILLVEAETKLKVALEAGLTERHKADMASDSWLSKNIRPISLISVIALFVILSLLDTLFSLEISEGLANILNAWGLAIFTFYFGSRGFEKVAVIRSKSQDGKN